MVEENTLEEINCRLAGKRIISIEPSEWSGLVRALTPNSGYLSMTLEDGTIVEVGSLLVREKEPEAEPQLP